MLFRSTAIPGSDVVRWYEDTIAAGSDHVSITIANFTIATGKGIPVQTGGSPATALSYTKSNGSVAIFAPGPVTESIPVAFRLVSL